MARYQSKQELEKIEMNRHVRTVVAALQQEVTTLGTSWGDVIPDDYSKQIFALVKQSDILQQVPEARWMRSNVAGLANDELTKPFLQIRQRQKKAQEKQRIAAFLEAAKNRLVVDEAVYGSSVVLGEIVRVRGEGNKPDRLLTCISCEYLYGEDGEGGADDGYLIKYAEPTEEEMRAEAYQQAKKHLDIDASYNETLRQQAKNLLENNEW